MYNAACYDYEFWGDYSDLKIINFSGSLNHAFLHPTKEQQDRFKITYSEWFDTREKIFAVIRRKGIYIPPCELEGIGMSFLETTAMGKAVIAVNNPTMSEYIKIR